ncbi:OPT family oligopeptide transporter [Aliikangiella sp. G2MR2-5]|uniref:OPT family oligopeptide transporter n=1 Tax=Aliikangiella sp. G2MR2-5 TaxID=2788943 RepID=UPI0018AC7672|nr:oligopeptide transporter, OPT family [Aliikangiella sp. G2MR2-5]
MSATENTPQTQSTEIDIPVVSPERSISEMTIKALILGLILSGLLAAANAYIGLLVGLTVSASIPAAAVSMGVLRLFRRSNILENNMVQTAASAGESLVAGIIFTIPALVIMGAWSEYDYWPLVGIAVMGGIMGVAFTIPLRRALIVEARLKFPEGVATAEVLKSGGVERDADQPEHQKDKKADAISSQNIKTLLKASGIGALFKLLESGLGWLAGGVATTKSWLTGKYLFTGDITLSPALLGVGYIVGLNIAMLVFIGGAIGTLIGVPVNWLLNSESIMNAVGIDPQLSWSEITSEQWEALAGESWQNCRRIGVGAMMVGGVWSLISLFKPLIAGVKASLEAYRHSKNGNSILRTEFDTPFNIVLMVVIFSLGPVFYIFYTALGDYPDKMLIASLMTTLMLIFGFIFASVAGYMAGLVGSSNNPISGVTIATVITSALILLQFMGNEGIAATLGPIAVIFLAGLICSAAAIAGDNMQDLKCGHIVGATPWRQQAFQIIGVVGAALVIPLVLQVLDAGYGIGRPSPVVESSNYLSAPQAGLMKDLATGIFGAGIKWNYIFVGFVLAVILIIMDEIQKKRGSSFRFPVLAVAVGVYLPLGLSVPILIGGILAHKVGKASESKDETVKQARESKGLLLASGLITGEALMGVIIAVIAAFVIQLPVAPLSSTIAGASGLVGMTAVIIYLARKTLKTDA